MSPNLHREKWGDKPRKPRNPQPKKQQRKRSLYQEGQILVCPQGDNCLEQFRPYQSNEIKFNGRGFEKKMPDDYVADDFREVSTFAEKRYHIDIDKCTQPDKINRKAWFQWKAFQAHISRCIEDPEKRPLSFRGTKLKEGTLPIKRGHCGCRDCSGNHAIGTTLPSYTIRRHKAFRYRNEDDIPFGYPDLRDLYQKLPIDERQVNIEEQLKYR